MEICVFQILYIKPYITFMLIHFATFDNLAYNAGCRIRSGLKEDCIHNHAIKISFPNSRMKENIKPYVIKLIRDDNTR